MQRDRVLPKFDAWFEPMEEAVPQTMDREAATAGHRLLARVREWWQNRSELDTMDRDELARIAKDLGTTGQELKDLAARGPDAASLLHERMHVLGLSRADVDRVMHGLIRDMERTCIWCGQKRVCRKDLAARAEDEAWSGYCPNAVALTGVKIVKQHFPA
jgi:hypothetical protein